jgi:hypothetical protein
MKDTLIADIKSNIENIKKEIKIDFIVDISEGYPNQFPQVHDIKFRYKQYNFIVILPRYTNGTPWKDIYNAAISEIIEKEDLLITKKYEHSRKGDHIDSTTNKSHIIKRDYCEDYEVNEIIGYGGFGRIYYVTHNINDFDYNEILNDNEDLLVDDEDWFDVSNIEMLKKVVDNYNDPKTEFSNKLNALRKELIVDIKPIIDEYDNKYKLLFDEYFNLGAYKVGDIVKLKYDDSLYIIDRYDSDIVDGNKISFNHRFNRFTPYDYWDSIDEPKITNRDIGNIAYVGRKINQSGIFAKQSKWLFSVNEKVGNSSDFKSPAEIKKLISELNKKKFALINNEIE